MNKIFLSFALFISFFIHASAQKTAKIDLNKSTVKWAGSHAFSFAGHSGIVKIKTGSLVTTNEKITGGSFIIDMNSIANTDGNYNKNLVDHLKGEDFFDVQNHPTAQLAIINVRYRDDGIAIIDANLTIKAITHPLRFEAKVDAENSQIESKFKIDRTLWKVNYKSKSIGARLKDGIISDEIEFRVVLKLD